MSRRALQPRDCTLIAATEALWSEAWIAWTADGLRSPMAFAYALNLSNGDIVPASRSFPAHSLTDTADDTPT